MQTFLECVPCFVKQALNAAKLISTDQKQHEEVLREVLTTTSTMDLTITPPAMGQKIHRIIRELTGNPDPYAHIKDRSNALMLRLYPELKKQAEEAFDPFETAAKLAIAGNIIDYAVKAELDEFDIQQTIEDALKDKLSASALEQFRDAIAKAESILYLADNAGEIVTDRILLEHLPKEKVTFAVRGKPVINDATMQDAKDAGITELVEVIDNGSDAPGTILETCSETFRKRFDQADLVIAKGQGNYETLSNVKKNIFYLFKVKCPVIAKDANLTVGNLALCQKANNCNL